MANPFDQFDTPSPAGASAPAAKPSLFDSALSAEGVTGPAADFTRSIYQQESGSGKNTKTSNAGATGGMQIIPSTFNSVADPGWSIDNPEHNARAGIRYATQMFNAAGGDPALAAAGYYGGPGGMAKARQGIAVSDPRNPNAPNTLQYGAQVASRVPTQNPLMQTANAVTSAIMPSANAATPQAANPFDQFDEPAPAKAPQSNSFDKFDATTPSGTNSVANNSFLENIGSGVKKGFTDLALGAKQRLDEGAAFLENKLGGQSVNQALGLQNAADIQKQTQAYVDQKRMDDAPLMKTAGGKIGNFAGQAIPAIAAAMLPGGQTLAGSVISGGIFGAAEPTATGESVAQNMLTSAAGGAAGYGIAKGIGTLAGKVADNAAAKAALNAPRDTVAGVAKDAGYVIPPSQSNPGFLNGALEGLAGKLSTAQKASVKNQEVTNRLAAQELGLNPAQPITKDALWNIRDTAGKAYADLGSIGNVPTDRPFLQKIADLGKANQLLAKNFPGMENSGIDNLTQSLSQPSFDAPAAVEALKHLRFAGNANKISLDPANKALGSVQTKAASAIEDLIDRHLTSTGQADLLSNFQGARQQIAKTYSVEKALNDTTGNVNAGKLAQQLAKGKPLSGNLQTIAQVGQGFPKAVQNITSSTPGVSPLDYLGAGLMHGVSGAASLLTLGARPLARATILSKPYQNTLGTPSYGGSAILNALSSNPGQMALQTIGAISPRQSVQSASGKELP